MYLIYGFISLLIIFFDQITKEWAVANLQNEAPIKVIDNFLQMKFVTNEGASFGILQGQFTLFVIATVVILAVILFIFIFNRNITKAGRVSLMFIFSGAIGNFIDRLRFRYVIDFIDVNFGKLYDFPVFNIADCFVVVGTFFLLILILTNKFENVNNYGKYKINFK